MRFRIVVLVPALLVVLGSVPHAMATCPDADADGYSPAGAGCGAIDCDDTDPDVHPGAPERCNGADDDCDLETDEEPAASASCASPCTATAACVAGSCVVTPQPNGLSCSDGNVCTGEEVCAGGTCTNPVDLDCDDDNGCTVDSCSPPNGCRNAPIPGCCVDDGDCADGSACTTGERCVSGSCQSDPVDCDDGNACTSDSCSPTLGCRNIAVINGIACGDGDVCNGIETCQGGTCTAGTPPACDDGSPCTVDACNPTAGCTMQQIPGCCATDVDCTDASACTTNERCTGNACVSDPLPCNDGNPCTTDGCVAATGCTFTPVPNGQACGDTDFCNGFETCQAGACSNGIAPFCDDGNPCTTDACNSATGCTHPAVAGCCFVDADCLDGDGCTIDERCVGGACTSDPRNCNDGNACTQDACVPAAGCVNIALVDGTSCADAQVCDGLETCNAGACQNGTPLDCNDGNACTNDSCDNTLGCRNPAVPGCCNSDSQCADTDQCTIDEHCLASHACSAQARDCSDGNTCTADSCNPATGCVNVPAPSPCNDGVACTANDSCTAGTCIGAPVQCADGDLCDGAEVCAPATGACSSAGIPSCTPGGRNPTRTCLAEWYVANPGNPGGPLAPIQACPQGNATCDHDDDPETCTFRLAVCLPVTDPRLGLGCLPADVQSYELPRSLLRRSQPIAAALMSALNSLSGASIGGTFANVVRFAPAIHETSCTPLISVTVAAGRRFTLKGNATSVDGLRDKDKLKLACIR